MKTLKLHHDFQLEGKTISGRILGVKWNDNKRGDCEDFYNKKRDFYICSAGYPLFYSSILLIWGVDKERDNEKISHTFPTTKRAKEVYDFIMEHTYKHDKKKPPFRAEAIKIEYKVKKPKKKVAKRVVKKGLPLTRVVILTPEEKQWDELLQALESASEKYKWQSGSKPTKYKHWYAYKENTCIAIGWDKDVWNIKECEISYCDKSYYEEHKANFITFEEAMKKLGKPSKSTKPASKSTKPKLIKIQPAIYKFDDSDTAYSDDGIEIGGELVRMKKTAEEWKEEMKKIRREVARWEKLKREGKI